VCRVSFSREEAVRRASRAFSLIKTRNLQNPVISARERGEGGVKRIAELFAFVSRWQPARRDVYRAPPLGIGHYKRAFPFAERAERRVSELDEVESAYQPRCFRAVIERNKVIARITQKSALTMPRDVLPEYLPLLPAARMHVRAARVAKRTESLNNKARA
jgi:hypothetical protein